MIRRVLSLFAVFLFVFLAIDTITTFASFPTNSPTILVAVGVPTSSKLEKFVESGVPAFASLTGKDGDYLVAGASQHGLSRIESLSLEYRTLTDKVDQQPIYIAYSAPNKPAPHWSDFGELLHNDGVQVILGMDDSEVERLAVLGVRLQRISLTPIVLSPAGGSVSFTADIEIDPVIQSMMDQVNGSKVYSYTGNLSGEWPVMIEGFPYTIITRHTNSGGPIEKATEYVTEHMENLGLDIEQHIWETGKPPNVIGELLGETNPEDVFLITAHIDDMPSGPVAPGADDNASGSTGVMIASDIFSQYRWGCTLRFAFFTGEEQGLHGSEAYADRSLADDENIVAVLNMDMIGYNTQSSDRIIDLEYASTVAGSKDIADMFSDVVDAYSINLIPDKNAGTCCSDHVPFLRNGFPAILAIEDFSDFNPNYHTTADLLSNLDKTYFTDFVKASIGTFAHLSNCMITGSMEGHVRNINDSTPMEGAIITIDGSAELYPSTATNVSGYYTITNSIGTYTVTASAPGYLSASVSSVDVISATTTTLDFELVPFGPVGYFPLIAYLD